MMRYRITVYCDGLEDARHERYVVISYVRLVDETFPDGRDWVPSRVWIDPDGRVRRIREHVANPIRDRPPNPRLRDAGIPNVRYGYRFRCPRCGFDEQRKDPPRHLDEVLDRLADDGKHEISVRELVEHAWG